MPLYILNEITNQKKSHQHKRDEDEKRNPFYLATEKTAGDEIEKQQYLYIIHVF